MCLLCTAPRYLINFPTKSDNTLHKRIGFPVIMKSSLCGISENYSQTWLYHPVFSFPPDFTFKPSLHGCIIDLEHFGHLRSVLCPGLCWLQFISFDYIYSQTLFSDSEWFWFTSTLSFCVSYRITVHRNSALVCTTR